MQIFPLTCISLRFPARGKQSANSDNSQSETDSLDTAKTSGSTAQMPMRVPTAPPRHRNAPVPPASMWYNTPASRGFRSEKALSRPERQSGNMGRKEFENYRTDDLALGEGLLHILGNSLEVSELLGSNLTPVRNGMQSKTIGTYVRELHAHVSLLEGQVATLHQVNAALDIRSKTFQLALEARSRKQLLEPAREEGGEDPNVAAPVSSSSSQPVMRVTVTTRPRTVDLPPAAAGGGHPSGVNPRLSKRATGMLEFPCEPPTWAAPKKVPLTGWRGNREMESKHAQMAGEISRLRRNSDRMGEVA